MFLSRTACLRNRFYSLQELVRPGENGMIFKTAGDLADQLLSWFREYPQNSLDRRQVFRDNLGKFQNERWHPTWKEVVLPHLRSLPDIRAS